MRLLFIFILLFAASFSANANGNGNQFKVDKEQLYCLSQNVYFEARGEHTAGQLAVAMVTMNRVYSKRFPNSICKVVWQRKQFSWTHDGKSDRPDDKKAWKLAQQIAKFVYKKYGSYKTMSNGALDLTRGALHYYAPDLADPRWAESKQVTRQIGGHLFLKENS